MQADNGEMEIWVIELKLHQKSAAKWALQTISFTFACNS